MLQLMLNRQYGVQVEEFMTIDSFEALQGSGWIYLIARPRRLEEEELSELEQIAVHMRNAGDAHVPIFIPSKEGKLITSWENEEYCVMAIQKLDKRKSGNLGRKLAKFHQRGKMVPFQIERSSRIGHWKDLWEKRLEQMEKVWNSLLFQTPEDEFEKMFIDSFPYYMGLTENAIQYLVDTEIDDEPMEVDSGTVCHERFSEKSWGVHSFIKNPFDWVFDHRSRDLAEWSRGRYFQNSQTYKRELEYFFQEYLKVTPLSAFSWKLLYSRLLFPLHYFECIENYYLARSEQEKKVMEDQLNKMLSRSTEYERFLGSFYQMAGAPVKKLYLQKPEWIY